jgi:ABC-type multidrug transport system fused ATPase/permease subunit
LGAPGPQAATSDYIAGLGALVLLLVGLYVAGALLTGLQFFLMNTTGFRVLRNLRVDIFRHIHRLSEQVRRNHLHIRRANHQHGNRHQYKPISPEIPPKARERSANILRLARLASQTEIGATTGTVHHRATPTLSFIICGISTAVSPINCDV